jgi:phenylacetate-CoA ligase
LQESEQWPAERLREFQFAEMRQLLPRLAATSPFYARRLAEVPVKELDSLEALRRHVPALSRADFSVNYRDILSREFHPRSAMKSGTSGTTGNSLQFYHPARHRQREWAFICHQWKRVGYDPVRSGRAEFRGLTRDGALFQEFPEQNMVRFSILDLRGGALPAMAQAITARRLTFYHGYPSAFYLLAREIQQSGMRFPQPEAVLLASEMVYDFQLEQIQAAFPKARLFAHYGCAEATVLAAWCEHRRVYHVLPQYSLAEIDSTTGEIIGTNLFNDVNGFVRYRMTDIACDVETAPCPACGRAYTPVFGHIDGRREDYLYSSERGWIAPAIVTYPLKNLRHIRELQFCQDQPEAITLKYLLHPSPNLEAVRQELAQIENDLRRLIGTAPRLNLEQVDELPRGPTGKFKWIVSRLDPRTSGLKGGNA